MQLIKERITIQELETVAQNQFGDLVKAVVDIEKKTMAVGGELHADGEALLLENGSKQANLWGINLYPEFWGSKDFVEFDSMINVRPSQGNLSRGVEDREMQAKIKLVVKQLVKP